MKYCFIILIFLISCNQELPDKKVLVKQYYDVKKNEFLSKKDINCKKEIRELAENKLDSIIDQIVKDRLLDSIAFPQRPDKPEKPDHIIDKVKKFNIDQKEKIKD